MPRYSVRTRDSGPDDRNYHAELLDRGVVIASFKDVPLADKICLALNSLRGLPVTN